MYKLIGKSNERILCKLNKSEILRLYSIVHVAMETTKTSNFTSQSQSFISIFFTCQVSASELQPFSCHDLANDIHSQTAKTVFSHLNQTSVCTELCSCMCMAVGNRKCCCLTQINETRPYFFYTERSCIIVIIYLFASFHATRSSYLNH